MRTAAVLAGSIIAIGVYLAVAAVFAFTATWTGLGILAISLFSAVTIVMADRRSASRGIGAA